MVGPSHTFHIKAQKSAKRSAIALGIAHALHPDCQILAVPQRARIQDAT